MPTAGDILLDTNALIAFLANDLAFNARFSAATVLIPAPALGEMYYGAYKSSRVQSNLDVLDRLLTSSTLLHCDSATARAYGLVKHRLKTKGRMIPENDVWIAALALQHGLPLATRDQHFAEVDQLTVNLW